MADRGFPAPHDGFCDLCSKPIAAGDRVCLLGWSEWGLHEWLGKWLEAQR